MALTNKGVPVTVNTSPSDAQIANAVACGWEYCDNGEFMKDTPDNGIMIGYYTSEGFKVE